MAAALCTEPEPVLSIPVLRLQVEQPGLDLEAAGKARQLAGGADHAMAWHDDGQRIAAIGVPRQRP